MCCTCPSACISIFSQSFFFSLLSPKPYRTATRTAIRLYPQHAARRPSLTHSPPDCFSFQPLNLLALFILSSFAASFARATVSCVCPLAICFSLASFYRLIHFPLELHITNQVAACGSDLASTGSYWPVSCFCCCMQREADRQRESIVALLCAAASRPAWLCRSLLLRTEYFVLF